MWGKLSTWHNFKLSWVLYRKTDLDKGATNDEIGMQEDCILDRKVRRLLRCWRRNFSSKELDKALAKSITGRRANRCESSEADTSSLCLKNSNKTIAYFIPV